MQQSNFIFGALVVAFLVFVTARGSLPVYVKVFTGEGGSDGATGSDGASGSGGQQAGSIAGSGNDGSGSALGLSIGGNNLLNFSNRDVFGWMFGDK